MARTKPTATAPVEDGDPPDRPWATVDGLPDEFGCEALVIGFWDEVRRDLRNWPVSRESMLADAHASLTHYRRVWGKKPRTQQRKTNKDKITTEEWRLINAEGRVLTLERQRRLARETIAWIESRDPSRGRGFAFWVGMMGIDPALIRAKLRVEFPESFALFGGA